MRYRYVFQHHVIHHSCFIQLKMASFCLLLRGANSGQSSIKCCDLACNVEQPPPLKICKYLTMELEVRFSQLHLLTHSFIYHQFGKRPRKEKNISTWYYDGKKSTNQGRHLQDFYKFSWGSKVPICQPTRKFPQWHY